MNISWNQILVAAAMVAASLPFLDNSSSQQDDETKKEKKESGVVVVFDQDGKKINSQKFKFSVDGNLSDRIKKLSTRFRSDDGKLVVLDENGKEREIDVSDAKSIIVNRSVKSSVQDGKTTSSVFGKAIVIGPDGVRNEYDLGAPDEIGDNVRKMFMIPGDVENLPGIFAELNIGSDDDSAITMFGKNVMQHPHLFRLNLGSNSKFMIGVGCRELSDELRAHLNLDSENGLIVESTIPEAPAAKADIKIHDILMAAGAIDLNKISDLVDVVEKAGEKDSAIPFTVIRKGKKFKIEVKPTARPKFEDMGMGRFELEFNSLGPGVIISGDGATPDVFQKEMDVLENEIRQMQETQKRLRDQLKRMKQKDNSSSNDSKLRT